MKSHLFAMFVWNFTTTGLSIAEKLPFYAVSNIANIINTCVLLTVLMPCQYWCQRLRIECW